MRRQPPRGAYIRSATTPGAPLFHTLVSSVTCLRAWQADYLVTSSGGLVSAWADIKNGFAASQATGSKQPILGTGVNSRPKITFDGVDDVLIDSVLDLPAPGTTPIFAWGIINQITWAASKAVWGAGSVGSVAQITGLTSTPNLVSYAGVATGPLNNGAALGSPVRVEQFHNNNTTDYLKLGSVSVTGVNTGNGNPAASWNLGAALNASSFGNFDIYACLVFSGKPSGAELSALDAAVTSWYGGLVGV